MHPYLCTDKRILWLLKELFPIRKSKSSNCLFSTTTLKNTQERFSFQFRDLCCRTFVGKEFQQHIHPQVLPLVCHDGGLVTFTEVTGRYLLCLLALHHLPHSASHSFLEFLLFYYSTSNRASKTFALIPGLGHDRHMSNSYVLGFKNFYSSPCSRISHDSIKWQNGILPNVSFSLKKRQLFKECCYTSHISSPKNGYL